MMHIGGVRTALFNWIFARQTGGKFILRIEDTDRKRYDPQALDSIKKSLRWLGLDWDEGPDVGGEHGPYFQSERREIYERYAERLTQSGAAYYCDCDSERLDQMRARQKAEKAPPGYDGHCRERNLTPTNAAAKPMAVRFKVPRAGEISFADEIHGQLTFALNTINDFIILKSDGMPTYHLAHVVDDSEMKISHVIRGEEWISSVPKHLLIQRALKFAAPKYVHVPLLLGKDRSKLSKRDGAVGVDEYIAAGYLPDTIFNFLALLGWSPGDDSEVLTRAEIAAKFSLARIQKHPAIFDADKLKWLNKQYIKALDGREFADAVAPFLERKASAGGLPDGVARPIDREYVAKLADCARERLEVLSDMASQMAFFFVETPDYDAELLLGKGATATETKQVLNAARARLDAIADSDFNAAQLEASLRELSAELNLKSGKVFYPLRIAMTGSKIAPPLFETIALIGKARALARIDAAVAKIER